VFSCRMCSMVECVLHETNNVFRWAVKVWSPKTVRCVCVCVCICVCVYIYIHTCSCWRLLRQMGQLTFAILRRVCVCVCVCVFVCVCVCVSYTAAGVSIGRWGSQSMEHQVLRCPTHLVWPQGRRYGRLILFLNTNFVP